MSDRQWRMLWAGWIAYFAAVEYAANRSGNPKAPLSYFMRHTLGIPYSPVHRHAGQVAFGSGIVWLISHLYERNDT